MEGIYEEMQNVGKGTPGLLLFPSIYWSDFTACHCRPFTVKHPRRSLTTRDYPHHVTLTTQENLAHFSSEVYVRAFNICSLADIQYLPKLTLCVFPPPDLLQLFSLDIPCLCIPSICEVCVMMQNTHVSSLHKSHHDHVDSHKGTVCSLATQGSRKYIDCP